MKRTWFCNFVAKIIGYYVSRQIRFAQLTAFLNRTQFNNYVRKYDGNRYVKHFTCWNQLLAMMFGQLSNRESLRDLIVALEAHRAKQYHLGLGRNTIVKATLAYANQTRDYRISKTLHSIWWRKLAKSEKPTFWIYQARSMLWFDNNSVVSSNFSMGKVQK